MSDKKLTERDDIPSQNQKIEEQMNTAENETADRLPGDRKEQQQSTEQTQQEQKETD